MKNSLAFLLTAALTCFAQASATAQRQPPPAALKEAVDDYWRGLAEGDKARSLKHVHRETLNAFLKRNEPALQEWQVESYQRLDAQRFQVTTAFKSHLPGGRLGPSRIRETWQLTEEGWKVRVLSLQEQHLKARQAMETPSKMPAQLQVLPETLKFRTHSDQPGVILIRNGLENEVEIEDLLFDEEQLEARLPDSKLIPGRGNARIALYWIAPTPGQEAEPTEESKRPEVVLLLKDGEERRRFVIPYLVDPEDPLLEWIKRQKVPSRPPDRDPPARR